MMQGVNKRQAVYACDIGGSKLLCGLVSESGEILDTERCSLTAEITTEKLEEYLIGFHQRLAARNPEWEILRCGINIPGLADPANGMWVYACFSGIRDYPIARRMEEALGLPVSIENDINACAWAEKLYGACKDCSDYLWVTVSNGVGGGLVLNGKIYAGAFGGAGEFGHIVVEPEGLPCPCGHKGCMEASAAGPAISRRYQALTGKICSAAEIAVLARNGEEQAVSVYRKTGEYIGRGLAKAASLLNLEQYILGGGVMQSFDLMEAEIRRVFEAEAFAAPNKNAMIRTTALRYEAGLLGAAAIAWCPPNNGKR